MLERIHGLGLLIRLDPPFGGDKSTSQILILEISRVYTSRLPRREMSSTALLSADSGTGSLFRAPDRLIRQMLWLPACSDRTNRIARPSEVQTGLAAWRL